MTATLLFKLASLSVGFYLRCVSAVSPLCLITFWEMRVDLDQIEFYHGPSRPPLSTSEKSVPPNHAPAHMPRYLQQSFPTGFGFCPGPCEVPLGQSPPLTGITHEWNIFDFEINHVYGPTQTEMTKDAGPLVTTDIPAACDILLDRGSSALAFSEPVPSTHSARTIPCPTGLNHLDPIPPDMRGDDLPGKLTNTLKFGHHPLIV